MSLAHLDVAVRVNVGAIGDRIPRAAEGIGLLRTELLFADHLSPPAERVQLASVLAVARKAGSYPVVARLFDAGGDKPLAWLPPPPQRRTRAASSCSFITRTCSRRSSASSRAPPRSADVRVLIPLVRTESDVDEVRARCGAAIAVGAMIESPAAVDRIDAIARAADFVCIGTNDLAAFVLGVDRANATLSLDRRVLALVRARRRRRARARPAGHRLRRDGGGRAGSARSWSAWASTR